MRAIRLTFLCLPLLASCAPPSAQPSRPAPSAAKIPPQEFASGLAEEAPVTNNGKQLFNDPSAPPDTPLCGTAAHEANQAGAAVYPQSLASPSSCPRNACFDPSTGTFIAADGNRSVCR